VVRDFVFGMEDGLVSNLGLVLGMYVGSGDQYPIILAGLASMFAGAFSMSAGSYLSAKSQREVYENEIKSVREDLENNPKQCLVEIKKVLRSEGLEKVKVDNFLGDYSKHKHPEFICNYLVQRKVGIAKEKLDLPLKNALTMFFSFLIGSAFPILPFVFSSGIWSAIVAVILTVTMLFVVGLIKTMYTKLNWLKSGLEMVIIGVGTGAIGYLVGSVIGKLF